MPDMSRARLTSSYHSTQSQRFLEEALLFCSLSVRNMRSGSSDGRYEMGRPTDEQGS